MNDAIPKTRSTAKSHKSEGIIRNCEEESKEKKEYEKNDCCLFPIRDKVSREQLIECEGERLRIELTLFTRMTRGTDTEEVTRSTRVSS